MVSAIGHQKMVKKCRGHKFEQLVTTCCDRLRESFRYGPSHYKDDSHFHYNFIFQRHMARMWYSAGETGIARLLLGNVF